ncbi:hypothetical protein F2Q69_00012255 [Brassica cretica]|uniref:Uncharacterized protein n=1 Tax=Brassica cretica TaxID=69181 RepID=A0A8S9QKP7_BRACR|nr:hypothetical protein F2Q69_00012255 [Brassica cretica]
MDFDHTFLWTATYWYPIEKDRLNVSSQTHNSSRLFCYAGSLSKGSDVGLVYPENMLSEIVENRTTKRTSNGRELERAGVEVARAGMRLCSSSIRNTLWLRLIGWTRAGTLARTD